MPLETAKKILNDPKASIQQLHDCISKISREIGHLSCRCNSEPQLVPDLIELEKIHDELQRKYNAKSESEPKNTQILQP